LRRKNKEGLRKTHCLASLVNKVCDTWRGHFGSRSSECRKRCRVECLFNRLKQNRRLATRYEKRAANYLTMVHIAAIRLWL
jgi:transposase